MISETFGKVVQPLLGLKMNRIKKNKEKGLTIFICLLPPVASRMRGNEIS